MPPIPQVVSRCVLAFTLAAAGFPAARAIVEAQQQSPAPASKPPPRPRRLAAERFKRIDEAIADDIKAQKLARAPSSSSDSAIAFCIARPTVTAPSNRRASR